MNLTIDQGDFIEIDNGSLASFQFLSRMDHLQHSLGSQFMGPPILFSSNELFNGTGKIQVMVPPNCVHAHVFMWAEGGSEVWILEFDATALFTTAVDSVGTRLKVFTETYTGEQANGVFDQSVQTGTTSDPDDKPWLKLVAGSSWDWQIAEMTVEVSTVCKAYTIGIFPFHNEWE